MSRVRLKRPRLLLGYVLGLVWSLSGLAAGSGLQRQLQMLAEQQHFTIEGLKQLGAEPAGQAEGSPLEQIRELLQDYNYLVTQTRPGMIETLRIISPRGQAARKSAADRAYVPTTRVGAHQQVDAVITGPNGVAKTLSLIIDTGASTLVLPTSMIPELGFTPTQLAEGNSQTANGTVSVKIGQLDSVRVGAVAADNIRVSFIDDASLSGTRLLGMSFLQRFRMTIDDANNELVLMVR